MKTKIDFVTAKFGEGLDMKEITREYTRVTYETADDVLSDLQDPEGLKNILRFVNAGREAIMRAALRNAIMSSEGGPERALDKLVKDIIKMRAAMGKPVSETKAKDMAKLIQAEEAVTA